MNTNLRKLLNDYGKTSFNTLAEIYEMKEKLFFPDGFDYSPKFDTYDKDTMFELDKIIFDYKLSDKQVVECINSIMQ